MNSEEVFVEIKNKTNEWVNSLWPIDKLPSLKYPDPNDVKIIRDAVTGYQILAPHEYLVLDHPVLQRLHYIHQTALSFLVYPSAHHTRFDHSLGCAKIAQTMGEYLISKESTSHILELRLAAILHDVGHTFFSHMSETIMQSHFNKHYLLLRAHPQFSGVDISLSEMMAYFIVTSEPFYKYLTTVVHHYHDDVNIDNVIKYIIHRPPNHL